MNRRQQRQRQQRARAKQRAAWLQGAKRFVIALTGLASVAALGYGIFWGLNRPIEHVDIDATWRRVQTHEVQNALDRFRDEHASLRFLSVSLPDLQTALQKIDWVDRARVHRRWPNRLQVQISEHLPAARWRDQGLLDVKGELFASAARHIPPELPQLSGPEGSHWQVAQRYLEIQKNLRAQGVSVTALRLDPKGAWWLQLAHARGDFEVRLGCCELNARVRRLNETVLPALLASAKGVDYVDLRYSNGFAVKYHAAAT